MGSTTGQELVPVSVLTDVSEQDLPPSGKIITGEIIARWFQLVRFDGCLPSHDGVGGHVQVSLLVRGMQGRLVRAELEHSSLSSEGF